VKIDRKFMAGMLFFAGLGAIAGFALFYYFSARVSGFLASAITARLFLVIAPHRRIQSGRHARDGHSREPRRRCSASAGRSP
jgi:hypothetical protein